MNVASLELCRELYELSGWKGTSYTFRSIDGKTWELFAPKRLERLDRSAGAVRPAYDLGYLMRKLPQIDVEKTKLHLTLLTLPKSFKAFYAKRGFGIRHGVTANTPEDAAASLAIKLFEQGILKPETN